MKEILVLSINAMYMLMCGYVLYANPGEQAIAMAIIGSGVIAILSIVGILLPTMYEDTIISESTNKRGQDND